MEWREGFLWVCPILFSHGNYERHRVLLGPWQNSTEKTVYQLRGRIMLDAKMRVGGYSIFDLD